MLKMTEKNTAHSSKEGKSELNTERPPSPNLLDKLQKRFAETLGLNDKSDEPAPKILETNTLDGIVSYIKKHNCKNIITMAGAGISTSAGIPDFRSPGSGLYDNLKQFNLPHPQAIFEMDFFKENPKPFFTLAKDLYPGVFKPTISHCFIKLLLNKNVLLRHYSQNIDALERVAGIPENKIIEAHGTFYTGHCLKCRKEYALEWMKERIFRDEVPECDKKGCKGVVKPDIVFFGESLPLKFHNSIMVDFPKCDLLIVLGSSLVVQPFASLIDMVPESCPRLLINREKVNTRSGLMAIWGMDSSGFEFDSEENSRDVFWGGECDDGCQLLADKLEWGDELKKIRDLAVSKVDEESKKSAL